MVDYEPLPAVVDPEDALAPDAPISSTSWSSNLAAGLRDAEDGDVLAGADVVVRGRFVNQRASRSCRWRATPSRSSPGARR